MSGAMNSQAAAAKPSLGAAVHAITGKWGWFVALGVGEFILGGIASSNLFAASLASALVIGAAMIGAGILQIVHGISMRGVRSFLPWQVGGIVYALAGAVIVYNPLLASLTLSLAVGAMLAASGLVRAWAGFHARPAAGWRWVVAAGVVTFIVGVVLLAAWPAIGLWYLGAMLVVDLIFQGWGLLAFGMALRARAVRQAKYPAAV
jgi:uncharacterized membrane protein HdeD (DUF308 family)